MTSKEKALDIAMLLGTAFAILAALFADFAGECDRLYDSTFRLHIPANSNSVRDQQIKYALRDYVLTELGDIFAECDTAAEAKAAAEQNADRISLRANQFLAEHGCEYTAEVTVGKADFPTRVYADYTLPSGSYDALRIVLGEGRGRNWWCVLYPDVCIGAASTQKSVLPQRTLYEHNKRLNRMTAESLNTERGGVEYRFALYDLIRALFGL